MARRRLNVTPHQPAASSAGMRRTPVCASVLYCGERVAVGSLPAVPVIWRMTVSHASSGADPERVADSGRDAAAPAAEPTVGSAEPSNPDPATRSDLPAEGGTPEASENRCARSTGMAPSPAPVPPATHRRPRAVSLPNTRRSWIRSSRTSCRGSTATRRRRGRMPGDVSSLTGWWSRPWLRRHRRVCSIGWGALVASGMTMSPVRPVTASSTIARPTSRVPPRSRWLSGSVGMVPPASNRATADCVMPAARASAAWLQARC